MADLNARIKPKKSSTASEVPLAADLEVAEIAVNTADGKLFTKHTDNSIKEIVGGSGGGATAIDDLTDVDTSTTPPTDGQVLTWDNANSQWEPANAPSGGATAIDDLTDVDTTTVAPTDGQALVWNNGASQWEPGGVSGEIEWTLTANGTTDYIFAGPGFAGTETDPDIYVIRGQTYKFTNTMGVHPFQIQSTQGAGGTAYNDGITNNAVSNGTLTWEVRMDSPSTLYYQCTSHADMNGTIYVLEQPGGGVTLPSANDGEALIYENGQWVAGPVIGGVNYTPSGDPNFNNVELLLLGNGVDGSTVFTDSSSNARTATATGNTQISTTQSKYGGASIYFDGAGDYLEFAPDTNLIDWHTGGAFTVEAWIYASSWSGWALNSIPFMCGNQSATQLQGFWGFGANNSGNAAFQYWTGSQTQYVTGSTNLSTGTWHHIAMSYDGTTIRVFQNGSLDASTTSIITPQTSLSYNFTIGALNNNFITGYIDDLRVTQGTARYTSNFTPPTAELPTSGGPPVNIPYSIDKLDDVDTSTVAPTSGQVLSWDNANSQWEPADLQGGAVRTALGIGEYVDDAAAGTGGVASGALYYNTTSSDYRLKT